MVHKSLELVSALLDPDERQSVLGDIHERSPDLRALLDLTGLALVRQLQAWQIWFPWMMTMLFPAFSVVYGTLAVGQTLWNISTLGTEAATVTACVALGTPILAWAAGYSLGSIGRHRAFVIFPCLAIIFAVLTQAEARKITRHGAYGVATVVVLMTVLALIPSLAGFARGLRQTPLARATVILLTALFALCAAVVVPKTTNLIPVNVITILPLTLWPAIYAFARNLHREAADAH